MRFLSPVLVFVMALPGAGPVRAGQKDQPAGPGNPARVQTPLTQEEREVLQQLELLEHLELLEKLELVKDLPVLEGNGGAK